MESFKKTDLTEEEICNLKIWDLPIYEIKIGGVKDGLSYRLGQKRVINDKTFEVSDIVRQFIDEERLYIVFGTNVDNREEIKPLKVSINNSIYITFKV